MFQKVDTANVMCPRNEKLLKNTLIVTFNNRLLELLMSVITIFLFCIFEEIETCL